MKDGKGLLVFKTTNLALKTESLLGGEGVPLSVIPTPVEITAECGIALLLDETWVEPAARILEGSGERGFRLIFPFVKGKRY